MILLSTTRQPNLVDYMQALSVGRQLYSANKVVGQGFGLANQGHCTDSQPLY